MSRRFGTVRKRPSGRFQAIHESGETGGRQVSRSFDTEREADDWLAAERAKIRNGDWLDPAGGRVELGRFFEVWIDGRPLAPRTVELYRWLWTHHIAPSLGRRELRHLTPSSVRSWHSSLVKAERPGPTTTAKTYRLLSATMSDAVRDGLIARNPCTIVGAGVEPRRPITLPSVADIEQLASVVPARFRALVLVAAYGGLRWGELAGLRPADVDTPRSTVTVSQVLSENLQGSLSFAAPKSAAGYRSVVLPVSVSKELEDHLRRHAAGGLVFTTQTGCPLRRPNFTQIWKRALRDGNLDSRMRFHDLRHAAATLATTHGATVREVQARLGHASPMAALRYQHVVGPSELRLASALDDLRGRAS